MKKLLLSCGIAALATSAAYGQSTGSVDFDHSEIIVTGAKTDKGVAGVVTPDSTKTQAVLTQTFIKNQRPGQSINEIINMLPGVSFQNNDAYGSSGGTLSIRGFDASRISQTFDGLPLNDTGNYALFSNQQLDPELIEQVNVNLGTTDIDSPTASATGSTVNYRTRNPTEDFHIRLQGSAGESGFFRVFGVIDTGVFTPFGTRAFFAASSADSYNPYQHTSKTHKTQYNAKIYQPIGDSGDFISIAGHYNRNRNGNFSSLPLRIDQVQSTTNPALRLVGSNAGNRFPLTRAERDYTLPSCQGDTPQAGVADVPQSSVVQGVSVVCGSLFDYSFNPSNTGNIRVQSKFTLADGLVLTIDPSFQYTKANGGNSAVKGNEGFYNRTGTVATGLTGYIGGQPYFGGVDLNGDGDVLDTPTSTTVNTTRGVEVYAPSHTETHRFGVLSSLRYDFSDTQTVRINYSLDYGRHRQTGPVTVLAEDGHTINVFPIDNPLKDSTGAPIQKRNRKSLAILNQVSGEYRGEFFDDKLTVKLGVKAPFFKRDLTNYCVTEAGGTFVDCFNSPTSQTAFLAANPTYIPPIHRVIKYNKVLPSAGLTYKLAPKVSMYASYNKSLQVPGTDNLYQSLGFAVGTANPVPETADNFDVGMRYTSSKIQAQVAGWYTVFSNRLASAYDRDLNISIYRNLGKVDKYGVDANLAYQPIPEVSLYVFGSYLKSKIRDNVELGACTAAQVTSGASAGVGNCTTVGQTIFALTAGKRESAAPIYTAGGRVEGTLGPVLLGVQAKRTGSRYVNDQNLPVTIAGSGQVYGAKAIGYTVVDADARVSLKFLGLNDQTFLQLNVTNIFDKLYVAGFSGSLISTSAPFAFVGAPRTFSGTLSVGF
ncbi:iron complex outermembrane recepter protein [Sphingomonas sp. YR710]|uniref:TonB-dependent receptor n=1 Tax=Sphingomonas sp. YR710 TaxID=1882773 RepID=UPI000891AF2E|nr:TonB-dependent receptor [Sphingomonas sp. YR710]SDD52187.1 iron complex outermembrane recepter protein [Sphingomonas sp. YR710]